MKQIFVFLAPGFEEIEALTAVDYLRRANLNVLTVAVPESGKTEASSVVTGSHGIPVTADALLQNCLPELKIGNLPCAIYFPGGLRGATNLAACSDVLDIIKQCYDAKKLVCAMCASPAMVLAKTGILAGKKWTCYPEMNKNLAEYCGSKEKAESLTAGCEHIENVPFVFDSNVLTGRGPGTAEQFAMKFVELLTDSSTAKQVHDVSCQR